MAIPGLEIRPAAQGDVPDVLALIRELAEYERAPQEVVATGEQLADGLFGSRPGVDALMASLDGQVVGFALYFTSFSTWLGRRGLYLEDLFVRPAARGRGVGRALLAELARIACSRGCQRLEWSVLDWNEPAIGFYRGLGAKAMDEWTVFRLTGEPLERLASESEGG